MSNKNVQIQRLHEMWHVEMLGLAFEHNLEIFFENKQTLTH